jgi:hypothetical protein
MAEHRGWAPDDADNEGLDARKAETSRPKPEDVGDAAAEDLPSQA